MPQIVRFGKYDLLERVNVGGMAEVWKARLRGVEGFEKIIALKRILPNIAEDTEFITMFIDEAKITVQLTHANIAQTHDLGKIDDSYFIAMEYVPGRDLRGIFDRARKRKQHVPVPLACYCISKVADALDYAHRKKDPQGRDLNIVHRDISPQNVLVSYDGEVKLIDFGIAKAASKASQTQAGILKGKFAYMSPEQIRGAPLDGRSDVFALGTVLYELLTGERLFVGESDFSTLENVRNMQILPPSTYNNRIPRELEPVVMKSLARDLNQRYRWASEFGADLQRFLLTQQSVFGPNDLAAYMRSTFSEEWNKEKAKAAELATAAAAPAAEPPPLSPPPHTGRAMTPGVPWESPVGSPAATTPPRIPGRSSLPPTSPSAAAGIPLAPPARGPALSPRVPVPPARAPERASGAPPWLGSLLAGAGGALVVALGVGAFLLFRSSAPPPGVLVVNATPVQAEVYVDGAREPGSVPFTLTLPPGDHDVEVRASGFATFRNRVQLPAGGQRIVDAELHAAQALPGH